MRLVFNSLGKSIGTNLSGVVEVVHIVSSKLYACAGRPISSV